MSIEFLCVCGKKLNAPENAAGRRARCPKCGIVVTIPTPGMTPSITSPPLISSVPQPAPIPQPRPVPSDGYDLLDAPVSRAVPGRAVEGGSGIVPASHAASAQYSTGGNDPMKSTPTLAPMAHQAQMPSRARRALRSFAYLLFLLTLIPLLVFTFLPHMELSDHLQQTLVAHPEISEQVKDVVENDHSTPEDLYAVLPGHRFEGALLAHDSEAHWLIALAAAVGFLVLLLVGFTNAAKYSKGLIFSAIFTGTVGVLLLLAFQFAAFSMPWIIPRGIVGIIFLVVKLIGESYALAESDHGFLLSFIGFTCGVGLCEEVTKAIPLLFRIKTTTGEEDATWNTLLIWGLASGIGFGIAEGVMYCGRGYNGLDGPGIYLVRFISCVGLHAMWAGAVGVTLYNHQSLLLNAANRWEYSARLVQIVLVPMILHGLYDTLLKQQHDAWALLVALASFCWLVFQIERMWRKPPEIVSTW